MPNMPKADKRTAYSIIGAVAFVVGGILTRNRAIEGCVEVEEFFARRKPEPELSPESEATLAQ